MDARVEARDSDIDRVPGGNIALGLMVVAWIAVLAIYLDHRIVLTSDSMNNYVHVWGIAHDLWHHGHLPWRMPVLGHGDAFAYPYGFTNWTTAAIVWPVLGNWGVTLWTALGAVGCIVATFVAFPELRHGWWAAAVLANPAIIEAMLFGQQTFAWGAALLLFGVAAWRRNRPLLAAVLVGLGQATHAAIVLPMGVLLVLAYLPFAPDRRALLRWYALSLLIALPAVWLVFASPGYADSSMRDRLVNFFGTLGPRIFVVALPIIFVLVRRTGIRVSAPLALILTLAVNVAFEQPLNVDWQWRGMIRSASTATLDTYLHSAQFVPGATYRVLRGAGDSKLGLYHVVRAGGRLDSELFPESEAMHSFSSLAQYEKLLCDRHVDYVVAYESYAKSRHTNELVVLRRLEAQPNPRVRVHPIQRAYDHVVYSVDRHGCREPDGLNLEPSVGAASYDAGRGHRRSARPLRDLLQLPRHRRVRNRRWPPGPMGFGVPLRHAAPIDDRRPRARGRDRHPHGDRSALTRRAGTQRRLRPGARGGLPPSPGRGGDPRGSPHRDLAEPPPGEVYVEMAMAGHAAIANILRVIAECEHAVVFHCSAGKDRTGIIAALLLATLGVPDETIVADYQLSEHALEPARAWAESNDPEWAARMAAFPPWLLQSPGLTLQAFLDRLRERHGSIDAYLRDAGVESSVGDELRGRLLEA